MASTHRLRGTVSVDRLSVGGVMLDPATFAGDDDAQGDAGGIVPQPVPAKGTVAALTEALIAAGVLVEDLEDDELEDG